MQRRKIAVALHSSLSRMIVVVKVPFHPYSSIDHGDGSLLTEQEVSRSWLNLFKGTELCDETIVKAASLLDELRPESPLRHRLDCELDEIRKRVASAT